MRTARQLVPMILALVLMGCTNITTVQPTPTIVAPATITPPSATSPDVAAEIAANYTRWKAADIRDYRFSLMVGCFCPMETTMPITVEVRDGKVISMVDAHGSVVSANDPGADFFLKYATIDSVYTELTSSWFREADKITVTFDPTYPIPATISADFIEMAVDDELYLGISGFAVISE